MGLIRLAIDTAMDDTVSLEQARQFVYCKSRDKLNYKSVKSFHLALWKVSKMQGIEPDILEGLRKVLKSRKISLRFLAKIVEQALLPGGTQRFILPESREQVQEPVSSVSEGSLEVAGAGEDNSSESFVALERADDATFASPFDSIRHFDGTHLDPELQEYWLARELQSFLEYGTWQNFEELIDRAAQSFETYKVHHGLELSRRDHFSEFTKMISTGKGAIREITDYRLSRHACHLIAQCGDPKKPRIAAAQAYFSIQTRRAELMDAGLTRIERTQEINRLITGLEEKVSKNSEVVEEGIEQLADQIDSLTNTFLSAMQGLSQRLSEMKDGANAGRVKGFTKSVKQKAAKYLYEFTKLNFPNTPGCDLIDRTTIVRADGTWTDACDFDHWDTATICNKVVNCVPMSRETHRRKTYKRADELTDEEKSVIKEFVSFVKRREEQELCVSHQIKLFDV
jgi:hypothetical protein